MEGKLTKRWYRGVFGRGFWTGFLDIKDDDMNEFLNVGEDDTKRIVEG